MWLLIDYFDGDFKATEVSMLLVRGGCLEYQELSSIPDNLTTTEYQQIRSMQIVGIMEREDLVATRLSALAVSRLNEYRKKENPK